MRDWAVLSKPHDRITDDDGDDGDYDRYHHIALYL